MPPRSVADVEWQLVMHFLRSSDVLRLGRCNTQLSQCVRQSFAWLHTEVRVELTALQLGIKLSSKHCLWTAAPIVLHWMPPFGIRSEELTKGQIGRLTNIPHLQLRSLDCSGFRPPVPDVWHLLLSNPALQGLRALIVHQLSSAATVDAEMIRLVAALPHLRTLQLCPHACEPSLLAPLAHMSSLTSLSITDAMTPQHSRIELIAACPHLRSLVLHDARFTGRLFRFFFASASIRHLRQLALHKWSAIGLEFHAPGDLISKDDLRGAMESLAELVELTLYECSHVQALIPHLLCLSAIERVVFQLDCWGYHFGPTASHSPRSTMPLIPDLQRLMTNRPRLQCVLEILPTRTMLKRADDVIRTWAQPLLDAFADRVELRLL